MPKSSPTRGNGGQSRFARSTASRLGVNATIYVPNVNGFDVTAGVRNILGKRVAVVAPGDFDRYDDTTTATTTVPVIPGEGREVYVKVGYNY